MYYEDCTPSPSNPTTVTVLGGTELNVLPTAVESLSQFKPGQQMTLLLTADGQVAGAVDSSASGARSNALAVVDGSGNMQLICGSTLVKINGSGSGYENSVVNVTSTKSGNKGKLSLRAVSGKVSGDLDVRAGTLGGKKLADNVLIFDGGKQVALAELSQSSIRSGNISYARTNWAGEIDLIVLNNSLSDNVIYGRAVVEFERDPDTGEKTDQKITIQTADKSYGPINSGNNVSTGTFVAVKIKTTANNTLMFTSFATMSKLSKVSSSAWIGKTAVNYGGRTYEVPSDVQCYNADTGKWMEDLDAAKNYGGTMNLYAYDGVIRIVEVKG